MAEITRKAGVIWNGDLQTGTGVISTQSQTLFEDPYSYSTRFEEMPGTNPEELIAAAHAACFSMSMADTLKKHGFDPVEVETNTTCTVVPKNGGGHEITHMLIHVRVEVPGIDEATFTKLAHEADKTCPVSNLLRNGLKITIDTTLIKP